MTFYNPFSETMLADRMRGIASQIVQYGWLLVAAVAALGVTKAMGWW